MKCRVNHLLMVGLCGIISMVGCSENSGDDNQNTISIAITSPETQTYVNGQVQVVVAVTGEVSRVELLVDGQVVGESVVAPFNINWDASDEAEGLYRLRAVAYGPADEEQTSAEHQILLDLTSPSLDFDGLGLPYIFSGTETIELVGADENELAELRLFIDGVEQPDCTPASCQVSWDTLTVADGPAELSAEAVDAAGNVTTLVRPVAVVNDGTVVDFSDGSGTGLYSIPADWAVLDLHQKYHVDMPAGVTEIMAIGQWYDVTWQMETDLGIGFCPDSGMTYVEHYDEGGQVVLSYTAADHGAAEFVSEQWFIHIGTGPDFDMDGHIDDSTYFALTFVIY
jgi:Bacterial Ig domain